MKPIPYYTAKIPEYSGCYIFRDGDLVLYVGMAQNLKKRFVVSNHRNIRIIEIFYPLATVEFVPCPLDQLRDKERELIKKLDPMLNKRHSITDKYFSNIGKYKRRVYEWATRRIGSAYERITKYLNTLEIPAS